MTPGDRVEASSLRKPALSVLYQRKLIAWWILQSVVAQQDGWPLQPYPLLTLPAGSVVGTCAEGSLTTQQASFVDHVAVVLEHFLGLLEHLQEAYLRWVGAGRLARVDFVSQRYLHDMQVFPLPPPNPACDFHRTGLSICCQTRPYDRAAFAFRRYSWIHSSTLALGYICSGFPTDCRPSPCDQLS